MAREAFAARGAATFAASRRTVGPLTLAEGSTGAAALGE